MKTQTQYYDWTATALESIEIKLDRMCLGSAVPPDLKPSLGRALQSVALVKRILRRRDSVNKRRRRRKYPQGELFA